MSEPDENAGWLGEAGLPWNILLHATLTTPLTAETVDRALDALRRDQGWPSGAAVSTQDLRGALTDLADTEPGQPVEARVVPGGLVVRADHAYVDGLGLLAVLARASGLDVASRARGVDADRPAAGPIGSIVRRLVEIGVRPSRLPATSATVPGDGDAFARAEVPGAVRTTAVVHAAAGALVDWNTRHGRRSSRVSVAVGVSRVGGAGLRVGDDSGFLRLTDVERMDQADVARAVATAPLQVGGGTGNRSARLARVVRWGAKALAPRLGSSILVSHLGRVEVDGIEDLAFYPVAGGGAGLSLGGVTVDDRTVVTLRARRSQHDDAGLAELLDLVTRRLG